MRSLLGTRAGFWGSRGRWLLATVPPHAGLNGPQATAGGPSLTIFTHPAHHDRTIAAPAGRPLREPCRPGVSATGGPRRGRKAYQTPNWRPGLRLGAPLDGLCGRLAHRYRYLRSSGRYPPAGLRHPPRCWRLAGQRSPLGAHRRHPAGPQRPCQVPVDRRPGELRGGRRMPPPGSSGPGRS